MLNFEIWGSIIFNIEVDSSSTNIDLSEAEGENKHQKFGEDQESDSPVDSTRINQISYNQEMESPLKSFSVEFNSEDDIIKETDKAIDKSRIFSSSKEEFI